MFSATKSWGKANAPVDDPRRVLVDQIVASKRFGRAPQLRDMLIYVVERSLAEEGVTITEHEIGSTALGRGPDFDPGHDNIVRAQMRHLRIKLEEYFQEEGSDEPLILTIPKGHYAADFTPRPPVPPIAADQMASPQVEQDRLAPRFSRLWAGLALALLAVIVVLLLGRRGAGVAVPEEYAFYSDILGRPGDGLAEETSLVLGNPVVILYAGAPTKNGHSIGASQGIQIPSEWQKQLEPAANRADLAMPHRLLQIKKNDYTGLGDATGCFHLGNLMTLLSRPTTVTQARFLNWDQAMGRTLIILGSPHTNQWAHGNVPNHDFRIVKMGVENQNPQPGEPGLYECVWDENGTAILDHGLLWAWRTPSGSRVLVLAGPSSAATGAMAGLFSDPAEFRPIHDRIGKDRRNDEFPANWQALFKIEIRDNLPIRTTYLTHRVYPSEF